jgi:curved DNA-binding protein CbpA
MDKKSELDYYDILGIKDKKAPQTEIKKKYISLVAKYHPDKNPDKDPIYFELIQRAWECLGNEENRKEYDFSQSINQEAIKNAHFKLRDKFREYKKLSNLEDNENINSEKVAKATLEYKKASEEMNKKHNFNNKELNHKYDNSELNNRIDNLKQIREQEDIEYTQDKIFNSKDNFNHYKFNALWDEYKKKDSNNYIQKYDNLSAFNDINSKSNYAGLNNYSDLYEETQENGLYSSFSNKHNDIKFNYKNYKNISDSSYYSGHNKKEENYSKNLNELLKKHKEERDYLSKLPMNEYKEIQDKVILDELFYNSKKEEYLTYNDKNHDKDLLNACNDLVELEKNN